MTTQTGPDTPEGLLFVLLEAAASANAVRAASLVGRNWPDPQPFTVDQMVGVWRMRWPRHERLQPPFRAAARVPQGLMLLMRVGVVEVVPGQDAFTAAGPVQLRDFLAARVGQADALDKTQPESDVLPVDEEARAAAEAVVEEVLSTGNPLSVRDLGSPGTADTLRTEQQ